MGAERRAMAAIMAARREGAIKQSDMSEEDEEGKTGGGEGVPRRQKKEGPKGQRSQRRGLE